MCHIPRPSAFIVALSTFSIIGGALIHNLGENISQKIKSHTIGQGQKILESAFV